MNSYQYKEIPQSREHTRTRKKSNWKPFLRQLLICSGVWTSVFLTGICAGAPTVFIPQIRREANNTEVITDDMASWITSAQSFSGFVFVIMITITTRFIGRKIPYLIGVADALAAFIVLYYSTKATHILISNIMQGFFFALQTTIIIMILTEYISPKYRGIFLTFKVATFYWGVWASNAIGTFFHWRNIPLVGIVCSLYTLLTVLMWPESPYWLASRGRFDDCAASHRFLKGCDEDAEEELEALINSQKEYIKRCATKKISVIKSVLNTFKTIISIEFCKPTLLAYITGFLATCSGKLIFAVYAIEVLKKITNSESMAYTAVLIIDGVTVLSMYAGCFLTKILKRRTLLFATSSVGIMFLFILSLYLYLISLNIILKNEYVTISIFVAFSIAASCIPFSISGELIPIRSRNLSTCIIALTGKLVNGLCFKLSPSLIKTYGMHGACLTFGVVSLIILIILYKYLPEIKDKSLPEIVDSIVGMVPSQREEASVPAVETLKGLNER